MLKSAKSVPLDSVIRVLSLIALVLVLSSSMWAQGLFATLTGVVSDPSGAVVANAKVVLRDAESGSTRNTVTNGEGYYTFASVPVGRYTLTVEVPGFQGYKADNVNLGGGERRNVNVTLQVGNATQTVEITGAADLIAPVDSGAKSNTLTQKELENFVQVGSNAAEFIKIMPGFGIQNGVSNRANYNGQTVGINANGDAGSQSPLNNAFSYNGLPGNTLDIVADGAHVSDPGCNCDTPVNPNSDFIQEFRVFTSNFSAEEQKGPMVITTVTKSGGTQFHGSGFFYARNYTLNSNDAYNNALGVQQPQNKYYYPGFTIGGPVIIPKTGLNKSRQKLFFWTGYEYFNQVLDTGTLTSNVPTSDMINGNFNGTLAASRFPGGQVPASLIDPNMQALMKLYPAPNANPATTGGYNYAQTEVFNQNNHQSASRVDYNISDNTKLFVRYNLQREVQQFPVGLWWRQGNQVPYPTPVQGKNRSDSLTGSLTHVFSPTMTNEVVMAYTFIGFPNVFENPAKVDRTKVGYTYPGLFKNNVAQIPSFGGSGASGTNLAALVFNPGGFEAGGATSGLYANKYMPSVSDTMTKVWNTHTIKAGFFYEWIRNAQPANNNTNGYLQFVPSNNTQFTYGDPYADMITGNMSQYQETNFNRINDIAYNTYEFFLQDSWKATRRLTLEAGLRFTHFTPWADRMGFGYSIFDPAQYQGAACAAAPTFCGFEWHSKDPNVSLGAFPTRTFFYQPRFGAAFDVTGNGNTVVRGGWGRFYYHSGQFTSGLDTAAGSESVTLTPTTIGNVPLLARNLSSIPFTATPPTPSAVDRKDDKQPYTDSFSVTVSQRLPFDSRVELGYVGNRSHDLQSSSGYGSNANLVPYGAMFSASNPFTANSNDYRPFQGYQDINQATNNLYANYNAFQLTWARQKGRYTMQASYTYGKALGIVCPGQTTLGGLCATTDPFNLRNNYGVQPGDRRHLFNISYSIELPSLAKSNALAKGVINGWQISGIVQAQSGANLTYQNGSANFNWQLTGVGGDNGSTLIIPGSQSAANPNGIGVSNQSIFGTNAMTLVPILTCDPTKNLAKHQFLNGACFTVPTTPGGGAPTLLPAMYGPAFFDADLGIFKNFRITESKSIQVRGQAYNFLNHPLWSFPNNDNLTLRFNQDAAGNITQTNTNFGYTTFKQGNRIVELAIKFIF